MSPESRQDRRNQPRYPGGRLNAQIRLKGQLARTMVDVLDFNRHGLAVRADRPLPKDQVVFISLSAGEHLIERVIGVVHNCLGQDGGFRCGILFRTQSSLQFDREQVESRLEALESVLSDQTAESA